MSEVVWRWARRLRRNTTDDAAAEGMPIFWMHWANFSTLSSTRSSSSPCGARRASPRFLFFLRGRMSWVVGVESEQSAALSLARAGRRRGRWRGERHRPLAGKKRDVGGVAVRKAQGRHRLAIGGAWRGGYSPSRELRRRFGQFRFITEVPTMCGASGFECGVVGGCWVANVENNKKRNTLCACRYPTGTQTTHTHTLSLSLSGSHTDRVLPEES